MDPPEQYTISSMLPKAPVEDTLRYWLRNILFLKDDQTIPPGMWDLPSNPMLDFIRGFDALITSITAQYPAFEPPTRKELCDASLSAEFGRCHQDFESFRHAKLILTHTGAVLHSWAKEYRDFSMQLGYIAEGAQTEVLKVSTTLRQPVFTVWVHADKSRTKLSGIIPREVTVPNDSSTTKSDQQFYDAVEHQPQPDDTIEKQTTFTETDSNNKSDSTIN